MRTAAIIDSETVINVIVIEEGEKGDQVLAHPNIVEITDSDTRIGDLYDGKTFTRVKTEQEVEAEKTYYELIQRRRTIAGRLGLNAEEVSALFGI